MEQLPSATAPSARAARAARTPDRASVERDRSPRPGTAPPTPKGLEDAVDKVRNRTARKMLLWHVLVLYAFCNMVAVGTFHYSLRKAGSHPNTRNTHEQFHNQNIHACKHMHTNPSSEPAAFHCAKLTACWHSWNLLPAEKGCRYYATSSCSTPCPTIRGRAAAPSSPRCPGSRSVDYG